MNKRIYIEKKPQFRTEENSLRKELNDSLSLDILSVRLINIYDCFDTDADLLDEAMWKIFAEKVTDDVLEDIDSSNLTIEYLPGQFDQRADSAMQCLGLIDPGNNTTIRTAKMYIFEGLAKGDLAKVKKYLINPVESREKDMSVLNHDLGIIPNDVEILKGFRMLQHDKVRALVQELGLAMSIDDLTFIQDYFREINRDPSLTEIKVLDTYWSDHCRHTTFETEIRKIQIKKSKYSTQLDNALAKYLRLKEKVSSHKPVTLMDMATISARYEMSRGNLDDLEISDEINACSIYIDIEVDERPEKWLLMFKNETHNHPTEIEPFGGASTCVGGAIRDPLSGRSYVYQAMRVTGAENPLSSIEDTIEGKLPQSVISKVSASGYSSYGNQIGLATTHIKEIYHPGYLAKHMEVGAVVGAVKADSVVREKPLPGDIVVMFGGRTGRDGIGGATGSSKEHNEDSIETASAEVQKGNAPEERKIQRLFRNPNVTKLIKKSNDFGAGGVSVAIGELADSLTIDLDQVRTKYDGLDGTELAISESQERMSVVIAASDYDQFISYCTGENLEAYKIADITDNGRLIIKWRGKTIVDLDRKFLDTNGVRQRTNAVINEISDYSYEKKELTKSNVIAHMSDMNISVNKGMIELFDSTVGAGTVLMPLGGKYQLTEAQASVHKIPLTTGSTNACSIMSFGFNPYLSEWSPFHGAKNAIIESISKVVAVGGDYSKIRFSFQEYFEKMVSPRSFGKPVASLLGAVDTLEQFGLAAIGGKDSMSGTFKDISVPPTLISFAVCQGDVDEIISNEFKVTGNYIYLIDSLSNGFDQDIDVLKRNFDFIKSCKSKVSSSAIVNGGIIESLIKSSLGNKIGFSVNTDIDLFELNYGSIVIESSEEIDYENAVYLGKTTEDIRVNDLSFEFTDFVNVFEAVYPETKKSKHTVLPFNQFNHSPKNLNEVKVLIPVFPGMNSEYDMQKSFAEAGGTVTMKVFRNLTKEDIEASIDELAIEISQTDIFAISGGFSAGDEPDGSGKFIANILANKKIKSALKEFLAREGMILGICNGFQALVKSGLLPAGDVDELSPTLFKNDIGRHISSITTTKVVSNLSPWLRGFSPGEEHQVAVSHGEGKFVASDSVIEELSNNGQIAFQYSEETGNPNGSNYSIEGITSKDGLVLGKMSHSERKGYSLYKNIPGNKNQDIFSNAINYLKGE